jgi:hypothetical protein
VATDIEMSFNQREWVNDIVTGVITGVVSGLVGVMPLPERPYLLAMTAAGLVGLASGLLVRPLQWLLNRRPDGNDDSASEPDEPTATLENSTSDERSTKGKDPNEET